MQVLLVDYLVKKRKVEKKVCKGMSLEECLNKFLQEPLPMWVVVVGAVGAAVVVAVGLVALNRCRLQPTRYGGYRRSKKRNSKRRSKKKGSKRRSKKGIKRRSKKGSKRAGKKTVCRINKRGKKVFRKRKTAFL